MGSKAKICWCGKRPGDKNAIVGCSMCSRNVHYGCLGVSITELDEIVNDRPSGYFCKECVPQLTNNVKKDFAKLSRSGAVFCYREAQPTGIIASPAPSNPADANHGSPNLSDVQNMIMSAVPAILESMMEKVLPKIMQVATDAATKAAMDHVEEMLEKRDKRRNLVFVGVPEQFDNRQDQNHADLDLVKDLCSKMSVDPEVIRTTFRDGQKNDKKAKRIMKICFKEGCGQERSTFLRSATNLVKEVDAFKHMTSKPFVRPDLTYKERQKEKVLRAELFVGKENGGDLIIRNGRLIPRPRSRSSRDNGDVEPVSPVVEN